MSYNTTPNRRNRSNSHHIDKTNQFLQNDSKDEVTPIQQLGSKIFQVNSNKFNIMEKNDDILEAISTRIRAIYNENKKIQEKYDVMMNQLEYARPADIKINNQHGGSCSHDVVKKVVQSAISLDTNNNSSIPNTLASEVTFHKHNIDLQKQIQLKMKQIEQIQLQIKTCMVKQSSAIFQYEKNEEQLKNILKSKGSLEDAEQKQKDKKNRINQIKYIRQLLQNYKEQKINKIQDVIHCLDVLKQCRNQRLHKVDEMFQFGQGIGLYNVNSVLIEFVSNLQQLRSQKIDMTIWANNNLFQQTNRQSFSIKQKILQNLNLNVTPRNSMVGNVNAFTTEKQQTQRNTQKNKNNNKLQAKKTLNNSSMFGQNQLYSQNSVRYNSNSSTPAKVPQAVKNPPIYLYQTQPQPQNHQEAVNTQIHLQQIIQQYNQISKQLLRVKQMQNTYFSQKSQRLNQQFRVKALEKYYLIGVLGYDPNNSAQLAKYDNIIHFTIRKCQNYSQYIEQKSKQQQKLSLKIKNVQESIELLTQQIQTISSQPARRKQARSQLQYCLSELTQANKKSSSKELHSQFQKLKIRKSLLQRQLEEFADQGDLEGYKRIKVKIQEIQYNITLMDKKLKHQDKVIHNNTSFIVSGIGSENGILINKVKQILQKNNIQVPLQRILYRNQQQLLIKLTRRLQAV